jgi:hypothetical protein
MKAQDDKVTEVLGEALQMIVQLDQHHKVLEDRVAALEAERS